MEKDLDSLPVRTYTPRDPFVSPLASYKRAAQEVWSTRWVLWSLFIRDFLGQSRQKVLGYLWTVLNPLVGIAAFLLLHAAGILRPGELSMPYPIFVFIGTGLWAVFVAVVQSFGTSLQSHGDLLVRTGIPKMGLALAGLANVVYGFLIHLATLALLLAWFRICPSWGACFYPLMMLPLFALGIGLGLVIGLLGIVARDIGNMVTTALNFLMYLTPVVYIADFQNPLLRCLMQWNPLTYLIDCPRTLFFTGQMVQVEGFVMAAVFSLAVLLMGIHAFYLIQDKISERI